MDTGEVMSVPEDSEATAFEHIVDNIITDTPIDSSASSQISQES